MISCESCRELLPEFSLGELEARDLKKVKYHVQRCRECALEVSQYRRAWMSIPLALDPIDPPEAIKTQLIERASKSPRVDRSRRRDPNFRESRSAGSRDLQRWHRYLAAAILLAGVFLLNQMFQETESTPQFSSNPEINVRVKKLADSIGYGHEIRSGNGNRSFVYVPLNDGVAYESLGTRPDAYAIWHRLTDKWYVFANSLSNDGTGNFKLWLKGHDGSLLASTDLVLREYGGSSAALQTASNTSFAKAMITLESSSSSKQPSKEVIFEADLMKPAIEPNEMEM